MHIDQYNTNWLIDVIALSRYGIGIDLVIKELDANKYGYSTDTAHDFFHVAVLSSIMLLCRQCVCVK